MCWVLILLRRLRAADPSHSSWNTKYKETSPHFQLLAAARPSRVRYVRAVRKPVTKDRPSSLFSYSSSSSSYFSTGLGLPLTAYTTPQRGFLRRTDRFSRRRPFRGPFIRPNCSRPTPRDGDTPSCASQQQGLASLGHRVALVPQVPRPDQSRSTRAVSHRFRCRIRHIVLVTRPRRHDGGQ